MTRELKVHKVFKVLLEFKVLTELRVCKVFREASFSRSNFSYTATANQTTFSGSDDNGNTLAYSGSNIDVYLNGSHLDPSDYTANNNSSVVLDSGASVGDILVVNAFESAGPQGIQGTQGTQGTQGIQGIQGTQGTTGTQGTQGIQGIQGTQGTQGLQGIQGFSFSKSVSSFSVTTSSQTTFTTDYTVGQIDVFLNGVRLSASDITATNGTSVVLGTAATFGDVVDIVKFESAGPQGTTGTQGTQGTQGSNYSRSSFSYTATANQTTFSGSDSNGNTLAYAVGELDVYLNGSHLDPSDFTATNGTSVVLDSGASVGDILSVSAFESAGPQGTAGAGGIQGRQGIQGTQGTQGIQGTTGTQGTDGTQGTQGIQGIQGITGVQGITGTQGTAGVLGGDGAQGATGTHGHSRFDRRRCFNSWRKNKRVLYPCLMAILNLNNCQKTIPNG